MLMKFMEILVSQGASQGGSSSARSFDLARHWYKLQVFVTFIAINT